MSPRRHSPIWGRVLLGGFDSVWSCTLLVTSVRDDFAEPVDMPKHVIEILGRALELSWITFPVKDVHRVFDGKHLVEEFRNRLAQLRCVSPSWRRGKHARPVGTKAVLFKMLAPAGYRTGRPLVPDHGLHGNGLSSVAQVRTPATSASQMPRELPKPAMNWLGSRAISSHTNCTIAEKVQEPCAHCEAHDEEEHEQPTHPYVTRGWLAVRRFGFHASLRYFDSVRGYCWVGE